VLEASGSWLDASHEDRKDGLVTAGPFRTLPDDSEVKGVVLRNFPEVVGSLCGDDVRVRALAGFPEELRHALANHAIAASGWYPLGWYREMHKAARRAASNPAGLARAIGRESTRRDLEGIYRTFLRVLSPSFVLSICTRAFGTYYRPGTMKLVESRKGFGRVQLTRCYGFDEDVWNDVIGGCEVTMEMAGAGELRLHLEQGGRDGNTESTLVAWWASEVHSSPPPGETPRPGST
jgi:hypothetical protein